MALTVVSCGTTPGGKEAAPAEKQAAPAPQKAVAPAAEKHAAPAAEKAPAPVTEKVPAPAAEKQPAPAGEKAPVEESTTFVVQTPAPAPETPKSEVQTELPQLNVPWAADVPKIDGKLDDPMWQQAAQADMFWLADKQKSVGKTRFLIARDENNLYIAVECFDDAETLGKLVAVVTQHDAAEIWSEDCVEIFMDPTNLRKSYYQIITNSKNVTWDAYHKTAGSPDMSWNPKYESAASVGDTSWIVEFAIPWKAFELSKESKAEWSFNVSRTRTAANEVAYWSSPDDTTSHRPDRFGTLTNMPVMPLSLEPEPVVNPAE
jgi:hypothetical protein